LKNPFYEFIPLLSAIQPMTGIVQFDTQKRLHSDGIANQKIQMPLGNFVKVGYILIRSSHKENIRQPHL